MAVREAILLTVFVLSVCGDVPYCKNGIPLNKSNIDPVYGWNPIAKCRLHQYRSQDVVHCLDKISSKINRKFHILVIGDSRMRQQFFELLSLIPDYDIEWSNFTEMRGAIHHDVDGDSSINNLKFSFHWRPLIDGVLFKEMLHLTDQHLDNAPDLILFGVGSHHMIHYNQDNHRWFKQELERLAPVLNKLTGRTRVVWWTQNPVIEYFTGINPFGSQVTVQKLVEYERSARTIFRNTEVEIWDSGLRMAEEYIRGCSINKRWDASKNRECSDSLHTGHLALFRGSQFLLNSLCNSFIFT